MARLPTIGGAATMSAPTGLSSSAPNCIAALASKSASVMALSALDFSTGVEDGVVPPLPFPVPRFRGSRSRLAAAKAEAPPAAAAAGLSFAPPPKMMSAIPAGRSLNTEIGGGCFFSASTALLSFSLTLDSFLGSLLTGPNSAGFRAVSFLGKGSSAKALSGS